MENKVRQKRAAFLPEAQALQAWGLAGGPALECGMGNLRPYMPPSGCREWIGGAAPEPQVKGRCRMV